MHAVRAANKRPSLLLFPDKSLGWMLAQPRYGVVALFLVFLVLHTCGRLKPVEPVSSPLVTPVNSGSGSTEMSEDPSVAEYPLLISSPTGFPFRPKGSP